MEYKNIFEELVDRGYFEQATYEDELKELLSKERVKFYIGFQDLLIFLMEMKL